MFARALHNDQHKRRFLIVVKNPGGWEVVEEQDSRVVKRVSYSDWHRVERARRIFTLEADSLCQAGWVNS
jgi:hypothetical protein